MPLPSGIGPGAGRDKVERDFRTESRDAALGGVTTIITTTLFGAESRGEVAEEAIRLGEANSAVDFRLTGVITQRQHLAEIADLTKLGVKSFKFFLGYKGAQAESFGMNADGISWDFFYQACEAIGEAGAQASSGRLRRRAATLPDAVCGAAKACRCRGDRGNSCRRLAAELGIDDRFS